MHALRKHSARGVLCGVCLLVFALGGCYTPRQRGEAISRYSAGGVATLAETQQQGTYLLYAGQNEKPEGAYVVGRGQRLGFRKAEGGQVTAVAGEHEVTVKDQDLVWRLRKPGD